jgi:trans-aconitate 2-methyltransferase
LADVTDTWDPEQYERFKAERTQPFIDLVNLIEPSGVADIVDLGCGTGELTARLHRQLAATTTLGVDRSASMVQRAAGAGSDGLSFELGDIADFGGPPRYDLVFANASLQWLPDHRAVLSAWTRALRRRGQLAVQVPANADHPSHLVAAEVAAEEPFRAAFGGTPPADPVLEVLAPEAYATLLADLGYAEQHVRLQVYGHWLPSTASVIEWVKGTTFNRFRPLLDDELFGRFVDRYGARLLDVVGDHQPYFYPFKRVLLWGRL